MTRALALLLLAAALPAQEVDLFDAIMRDGVGLYYRDRYDEALVRFRKLSEMEPKNWRGHTWQALTLIRQAAAQTDLRRRNVLVDEAESLLGPLVKQAGVRFNDPLRNYLLGLIANLRADDSRSLTHLTKAVSAPAPSFLPYEEIGLKQIVDRAYGQANMELAKRLILLGRFTDAAPLLKRAAKKIPETDRARVELERHLAVVEEALGHMDAAVGHLRNCMRLLKDNKDLVQECIGTIANIYFAEQRFEEGMKVLEEAPEGTRHPDILAARCSAHKFKALRAPDSPAMDDALAYYDKVLKDFPVEDRYRLVIGYAELVLEKVGPAQAAQERPLLEAAVALLKHETEIRPECAPLYWSLHRIHRLLGNEKEAEEYKKLHEKKKEEFDDKAQYDERGRPRCG